MGLYKPWGCGYGGYGYGYGAGIGAFGNNSFVLLVVLFVLLIIVGNSFPTGGDIIDSKQSNISKLQSFSICLLSLVPSDFNDSKSSSISNRRRWCNVQFSLQIQRKTCCSPGLLWQSLQRSYSICHTKRILPQRTRVWRNILPILYNRFYSITIVPIFHLKQKAK